MGGDCGGTVAAPPLILLVLLVLVTAQAAGAAWASGLDVHADLADLRAVRHELEARAAGPGLAADRRPPVAVAPGATVAAVGDRAQVGGAVGVVERRALGRVLHEEPVPAAAGAVDLQPAPADRDAVLAGGHGVALDPDRAGQRAAGDVGVGRRSSDDRQTDHQTDRGHQDAEASEHRPHSG